MHIDDALAIACVLATDVAHNAPEGAPAFAATLVAAHLGLLLGMRLALVNPDMATEMVEEAASEESLLTSEMLGDIKEMIAAGRKLGDGDEVGL